MAIVGSSWQNAAGIGVTPACLRKVAEPKFRQDQLQAFKDLASLYGGRPDAEVNKAVSAKKSVEIDHDREQKENQKPCDGVDP